MKKGTRKKTYKYILLAAAMLICAGCASTANDASNAGNASNEGNNTQAGTSDQAELPVISVGEASEDGPSADSKDESEAKMEGENDTDKAEVMKERTYVRLAEYPESDSCFLQPVLQNPGDTSVTVQWFTQSEGSNSFVSLFEGDCGTEPSRTIEARTYKLSRIRGGKEEGNCNDPTIKTAVYKHVAVVEDLPEYHGREEERIAYSVTTDDAVSQLYTLAAKPQPGTPLKILFTSDMQIKNMCAANIQKLYETVGSVDAIFFDGDIVDVADRAYDWFYADNALFRVFTGTAKDEIGGETYRGAPILQTTPMYTAIGNHDVMGVYDETTDLSVQFNYPSTREHAAKLWDRQGSGNRDDYIRDHSYNTITYEEMFELPSAGSDGEKYYALTFGDVRLVTLDASRVWRQPAMGSIGKYTEMPGGDEFSSVFGFGDFIFEPLSEGSAQIDFLKKEVAGTDYKDAKFRVAMLHNEAHSLGGNQIPAFTDPVAQTVTDPVSGQKMVVYTYPQDKDYINTVVEPILEKSGTELLFEAHSHLWNRFKTAGGMDVLETSNVGNSYGGFVGEKKDGVVVEGGTDGGARADTPSALKEGDPYAAIRDVFNADDYPLTGDPLGLEPIAPTEKALPGGRAFLASNTITAFSVLDTATGCMESYYFDTEDAGSRAVLFDRFTLGE